MQKEKSAKPKGEARGDTLDRRQYDQPFVVVPNQTILDSRMTPEALGVLTYILARAQEDGRFGVQEIQRSFSWRPGSKSAAACVAELEELGYLERREVTINAQRVAQYTVNAAVEGAVL